MKRNRRKPQVSKYASSNHPLFLTWQRMKGRCYNNKTKSHKDYEGKGIIVCDEWLNNKDSFFEWSINNGWKKGLTIDRIDPNGNYEPNNCQWLTKAENNARTLRDRRGMLSRNHLLTDDHVRAIRMLYRLKFEAYGIAAFFGVSTGTVYDILKNRTWTHII